MPTPITTGRTTGFEGLSALATDVDSAVAEAERIAAAPPRMAATRATNSSNAPSTPVHSDGGAIPAVLQKIGGWVLGIGILVALKTCIWGGIHAVSDSGNPSYSAAPAEEPQVPDTTGNSANGESEVTTPPAIGEAAAPEGDDVESKPAPGFATLSLPEIRFCLAEDIRIKAQKVEIEGLQFTNTNRFNANVDDFNEAVNDYNSRCSDRSIIASDRPTATSQVEAQRSRLEMEGRARVH